MAGLAPTASVFIMGRALTGCGAGALFTTTNVLLIEGAPVHRRGLLLGIVNCVVTAGSSLGGVIGGAFAASSYGWVSSVNILLFSFRSLKHLYFNRDRLSYCKHQ